jgi:hypothetical protein
MGKWKKGEECYSTDYGTRILVPRRTIQIPACMI